MTSKKNKVKVPKPTEVLKQVQEVKMMDYEQLHRYLEARNGGLNHDDAVDAVLHFFGVPL